MAKQTILICDNCGVETRIPVKDSEFPYNSGWVYLYNINFKFDKFKRELKDLHFCKPECAGFFLSELLEGKRETSKSIDDD